MLRGFFSGIWKLLSGVSRVISVLVPLIFAGVFVFAVVTGLRNAQPEPLPPKAALLINPAGVLVESRTPLEPIEAFMQGEEAEVLLSDVVEAIDRAADDARISALVLDLQALIGPSLTQAFELRQALDRFKSAGKPVVAVGDYYDQSHYLLAAQADTVVLHPEGAVALQGYGVYRNYVRELLNNAMITMNVFRVGEYKSAVEPFLRDDMSDGERQVVEQWLGTLWGEYTALVESSRELEPGAIDRFVTEFPERLEQADGNMAQLMLDAGLVDDLMGREQQAEWLASVAGATDESGAFESVDFRRYLAEPAMPIEPNTTSKIIAVVPVEGELVPGESGAGFAGSDTVVEQLEQAAEQEDVAALVLRVNSPGGSVFASEVIRQKVLAIKEMGIPVVVSMGSVAASGGYYIAADADEIWALPGTITGSIGVFAAFPTIERLYDWAGITVDGVGTTPLASAMRFDTGVDENGARIITSVVNYIYRDFVELVAAGRGMTWDDVDAIAGGRVWSGRDASENGLVDKLGGLEEAVAAAARLAQLDDWEVKRVGTPLTPEQLMFEELGRKFGVARVPMANVVSDFATRLAQPLRVLDSLQDPKNVYVRCLDCTVGF